MTIDELGSMDVLEKGEVRWSHVEQTPPRSRAAGSAIYFRIIVSVIILLLLWRHAPLTSIFATVCTYDKPAIPPYVMKYAPVVWLDIGEGYFPSDIFAQVENTRPNVNFTTISNPPANLTLENLDSLNAFGNNGMNVYLTSTIDVTTSPNWIEGVVPDATGKTDDAITSVIIVNDHGSGNVDAFYMYFYAFNQGNTVLFRELGNHVGDWEHNMIRFQHGKPTAVWYSQHGNGQAFTYKAVEKEGVRPVSYAARGSHANYAIPGAHDHTIPGLNLPDGFIVDYTSPGTLWDPTLNTYLYTYDGETATFSSADGESPLGAMAYKGRWGDEQYPESDPRQGRFFGFYKFVGGPTGPWDKSLNRTLICPDNGIPCIVRTGLGP